MRPSLCFAKLPLILMIILLTAKIPAASAIQSTFPEPYSCYRSSADVTIRMQELASRYPALARVKTIGQSFEGRPIQVLQIGRETETYTHPKLVLISGLQANALAPVELNLRFAEALLQDYGQDPNITWLLDQTETHLIMVANPDGRLIAEDQIISGTSPSWTKNRQPHECTNGNGGVLLGMNFSFEWAPVSTNACASDYPGPSEASEPETQSIQDYLGQILASNPQRSLVIELQTNGDQLLTPFLYSKTAENPHEDELYMLANKLIFGNQAVPLRGSSPQAGTLSGSLTDFAFGSLQTPALFFRMGSPLAGGDSAQCWYFNDYLEPEGLSMLSRALLLSVDPLVQAQGPEISITDVELRSDSVHVTGQADDFSFYKLWLSQTEYSAIHHVSFTLDQTPWQPDANLMDTDWLQPLPAAPFVAEFGHTFRWLDLTPGSHTIYFQAWDTAPDGQVGRPGLINAVEILVPWRSYIPLIVRQ